MIGVDTNVLVRFLTADVVTQHRQSLDFFGSRSPDDPAFISAVTLAETVWILRRSYGFPASEIASCVNWLLDSKDVQVEGREALKIAAVSEAKPALFADILIAHLGSRAGCSRTVTFDRRPAANIPGMELLA